MRHREYSRCPATGTGLGMSSGTSGPGRAAKESQPRWTTRVLSRSVVTGENPSNHVFVDGDVESPGNLLSNSRTAPGGITLLYLDDGFDEFLIGPLWSGLTPALG